MDLSHSQVCSLEDKDDASNVMAHVSTLYSREVSTSWVNCAGSWIGSAIVALENKPWHGVGECDHEKPNDSWLCWLKLLACLGL